MPYLFPLENYDCSLPFFQEVSNVSTTLLRKLKFAPKPSVDKTRILELHKSGMGPTAITKELSISRATVYRALH